MMVQSSDAVSNRPGMNGDSCTVYTAPKWPVKLLIKAPSEASLPSCKQPSPVVSRKFWLLLLKIRL